MSEFCPPLRNVEFCSSCIYSPRGTGFGSEASRRLCSRLKTGDAEWLPAYARVVRDQASRHEALYGLFSGDVTLVPVPGSAPQSKRVWAAERLAAVLFGLGLGRRVWSGVQRSTAVRRSATAINADRPTVQQHFESLSISTHAPRATGRMVLIDDVITKGRTILAAAARLHEAFPGADIRAFALVRTMGLLADVAGPLGPCQGVVRWAGGDAWRDP